jgi:hypothetical protein
MLRLSFIVNSISLGRSGVFCVLRRSHVLEKQKVALLLGLMNEKVRRYPNTSLSTAHCISDLSNWAEKASITLRNVAYLRMRGFSSGRL